MIIHLFGDLWGLDGVSISPSLKQAELSFFNLETPIINDYCMSQKNKCGVTLKTSFTSIQNIIQQFDGSVFLSLANNHIADYGEAGIKSTIEACERLNVCYYGVGYRNNMCPKIIKCQDNEIAVFVIAERQFGITSSNELGYSYYEESIFPQIIKAKNEGLFVIVSFHYGAEMSIWPSPDNQMLSRSFIDCGADVVYGHHSHVPKGFEKYHNGLIFYGLGNFTISKDYMSFGDNLDWSNMVELDISQNIIQNWEIIPIQMNQVNVQKMSSDNKWQKYMHDACSPLNNELFLEGLWQSFVVKMYDNEYSYWFQTQGKHDYRLMYHLFNCSTHCSSVRTYFGLKSGNIKDVRDKKVNELSQKYFQLF